MLPSPVPTTVVGWHQSRGASEPDAKAASRSCSFLLSPTASLTSAIAACVCVHGGRGAQHAECWRQCSARFWAPIIEATTIHGFIAYTREDPSLSPSDRVSEAHRIRV